MAELQRSDAKATGIGAAAVGGITMATALSSTLPPLSPAAKVTLLGAIALLLGALALSLAAARPRLRHEGHRPLSYLEFAGLTPEQLVESFSERNSGDLATAHARRLVELSRLVLRKYRLLRRAVDLLSCGLALATVAAALMLAAH
ncbi:Pycsar system effector family protein [Kitasatospora sp. NPDC058444]|uniref:Pycsar system effector family protein n=1 Tax=Kitasatospora sp. NPDC058444 TaxID=3346504 RepID=UPI00365E86DC